MCFCFVFSSSTKGESFGCFLIVDGGEWKGRGIAKCCYSFDFYHLNSIHIYTLHRTSIYSPNS